MINAGLKYHCQNVGISGHTRQLEVCYISTGLTRVSGSNNHCHCHALCMLASTVLPPWKE